MSDVPWTNSRIRASFNSSCRPFGRPGWLLNRPSHKPPLESFTYISTITITHSYTIVYPVPLWFWPRPSACSIIAFWTQIQCTWPISVLLFSSLDVLVHQMEEDLIVVDDIDVETQPDSLSNGLPSSQSLPQRTLPERASSSRLRSGYNMSGEGSERTTRSSAMKPKLQPKLKLKLSEKAAAQAPGMSFLGPYDRELDSDEEELAFEEQFILRMPPGEDSEKLRKMMQSREVPNDVWFKFKGGLC